MTLRRITVLITVSAALAVGAAPASAGTLQFDRLFPGKWKQTTCTHGSTIAACFVVDASAVVRGLGRVTLQEQVIQSGEMDFDFCEPQIRIGKLTTARGTIDYLGSGIDCPGTREQTGGYRGVVFQWNAVGGTGAYAGVTGSGDATVRPEVDEVFIHFHGAVEVPGVAFDTTPPVLASVPRAVRIESAGPTTVRYRLPTARDAVDGNVPVKCTPAAGSRFKLGRTTVSCEAWDSSGNPARASFVVHVRRGGR
jgi:hypothetical protein